MITYSTVLTKLSNRVDVETQCENQLLERHTEIRDRYKSRQEQIEKEFPFYYIIIDGILYGMSNTASIDDNSDKNCITNELYPSFNRPSYTVLIRCKDFDEFRQILKTI